MRRRSAAVLLGGHLDPQLTMTLCSLPFWQLEERQEVERGGQGEKIWIQIFFSFFLFFFGGGGGGGKNLDPSSKFEAYRIQVKHNGRLDFRRSLESSLSQFYSETF